MRSVVLSSLLVAAACALAGAPARAAKVDWAPGVIALYEGEPITIEDVRREEEAMSLRPDGPGDRAALNQIILRRILAKKARQAGLDKADDFAVQTKRSEEALLAQQYERDIAVGASAPSADDISTFIAAHPERFAERKVYILRQIYAAPTDRDPQRFVPLHDLKAIKALLDKEAAPYQESATTMDTASADPLLLQQLAHVPKGEVFVLPRGRGFLFNQIVQTLPLPVQGRVAAIVAANTLKAQRSREAMQRELRSIVAGETSSLIYAPMYRSALQPPPPVAAPPPPRRR